MKFKNYILLILFLAGVRCAAQPYQSIFGNNSTQWVFMWNDLPGWLTDTVYTHGDTLVNGKSYKKLIAANPTYPGGLIREDINTGEVWYRDIRMNNSLNDTIERMVFRFDLNEGDTFDISNAMLQRWSYPDSFNIVDSVRIIGGKRHIYFKGFYDYYIYSNGQYVHYREPYTFIEGLGTNIGVIWKHLPTNMQGQYLLCSYKDNFKTSFSNKAYNGSCAIPTSIAGTNLANFFSVHPNPVSGVLTLSLGNKAEKAYRVTVTDISGKVVYAADKAVFVNGNYTFNTARLVAGTYFVNLADNTGKTQAKQFVKVE